MKKLFHSSWSFSLNRFDSICSNILLKMVSLENLHFDNLVLRLLPIDTEDKNYVRTVNGACFSKVKPTPVRNPIVVATSLSAMRLLGLPESELQRKEFAEYFSGNNLLPGSEPAAHCYCGHQFGAFSGQLGDGAAVYLGEVVNTINERWEIQLKGAGLTPYSRTADGRKVLRSSIREFLCSEAMHFLGIPTSRAGTFITSISEVIRDIFYDGHPKSEKCTIVLRIAPTFIRFGSFEIFRTLDPMTGKVGPSVGRIDILHTLLNYVIDTFFPEISANSKEREQKYALFFKEVVLSTARLVALWQSVGFCHGVLNTDNMSILGLTLDYGPFGFLDIYDPDHICNASDGGGRYSFINQPEICLWNLKKLAEAIQQALSLDTSLPLLDLYQTEFQATFLKKMQDKLGLISRDFPDDKDLIEDLFSTMEKTGADFTNTFLCFSILDVKAISETIEVVQENILQQCYPLQVMIEKYNQKNSSDQLQAIIAIANSNPSLLEQLGRSSSVIQRAQLQMKKLKALKQMSEKNKGESDKKLWSQWLKKYQQRVENDVESYEGDVASYNFKRQSIMKNSNPRFILRNYILQEAIEKAENGDYSQVRNLVTAIENPYEYSDFGNKGDITVPTVESEMKESSPANSKSTCETFRKTPTWGFSLKVS